MTLEDWLDRELSNDRRETVFLPVMGLLVAQLAAGVLMYGYMKYKEGAPEREKAAMIAKAEEQLKINRMADSLAIYGVRP